MKLLLHAITQVRDQEAFMAEKIHGPRFDSFSQGYTALAEEIQEAQDEIRIVDKCQDMLLRLMRSGQTARAEKVEDVLFDLEQHALLAACEMVQVAYVAGKMMRSLEGWK